ncbi:MAG: 2-oxoglutarate dehydrogenase complex dihydrolipoyllysine-residue succinyltransferase [Proteobacteria bacterium]|nr:2-oxoglutarate dehydrogenase complex dihydrolipoyllysine-residue succinyltransferase [Pseudomonadota bacterium]
MTKTYDIKVPSLGESVVEATVARWLKKKGDFVKTDETLVELETDKVTLEVSSPASGYLDDIHYEAGSTVVVGGLLGKIVEAQEETFITPSMTTPSSFTTPPISSDPFILAIGGMAPASAMPSAKKLMEENDISPYDIQGTGKDKRITKGDVLEYLEKQPEADKTFSENSSKEEKRVKMSKLRQRIAERLKQAQNTAAILTTFNEIDLSAIQDYRSRYKEIFEKKHSVKLGFMSFFVKASLQALSEFPAVNAEIQGDEMVYKNYYDIGVAVSAPQGLVVPIIKDANHLSFADIEKTIAKLGEKARDNKLTLEELTGGTFTISNGGIFGSLLSTPILNPPQSAILGMHKIQDRPVAVKGQIVIRPMMYVALSYDHRIIDGREAVLFLVRIKESLENPERLLLDL